MNEWSSEHLTFITKQYLLRGRRILEVQRSFKNHFRLNKSPSKKIIYRCIRNFNNSGSIEKKKPGAFLVKRTPEKITAVQQRVNENPQISIRQLAQQTDTKKSTLHNILKKDLHLYPYKVQNVQEISDLDKTKRLEFSHWFLRQASNEHTFLDKLITSDEAHFHLKEKYNKQNTRIWCTENPWMVNEQPLHSQRVTVWCGMTSSEIIGPYFFEDQNANTVTVKADNYGHMLLNFLIPRVHELYRDYWFQQDGAPCHTARTSMTILKNNFPLKLISRHGDVNWPARSPDLSPLDFFLWGYLKSKVYKNNPTTLQDLKRNITAEINMISADTLWKVMHNSMIERVHECSRQAGDHIKGIVFKK
ncbi:MAG: hypothetical protein AAGC64_14275 [Bacteroidota bacterium]